MLVFCIVGDRAAVYIGRGSDGVLLTGISAELASRKL
jgi:hypothetical protein